MIITIMTLFPEILTAFFNHSIIKRGQSRGRVTINYLNPRDFTTDKHRTVDDHPFGGGAGMLMMIEPLVKAIEQAENKYGQGYKILLTPQGQLWNQSLALKYLKLKSEHLILICGHYEGIDVRIEQFIDAQISIGNYVLSGGEAAAIVLVDTLVRLIPAVLKKEIAIEEETFMQINQEELYKLTKDPALKNKNNPEQTKLSLYEYPQYTKPVSFRGLKVPKILLSGNHAEIRAWRLKKAWQRTKQTRI